MVDFLFLMKEDLKMFKVQLKEEANKVMKIVETGKLEVDGKEIDINDKLIAWTSKEYRRDNIDKIKVTDYEKVEGPCDYIMTADGSDTLVFNPIYNGKKVCILNFASSKHPGGGFLGGATAQEEALCQASNLYSILNEHNDFYSYNQEHLHNGLYSDGVIYSSNVVFFRNKYVNHEPIIADVITCAAPNRGSALRKQVSEEEIECTMSRRLEQIMKVAIANGARILALGAFGCGVFRNDPKKVASIIYTLLDVRGYKEYFEEIILPMNGTTGKNVEAFEDVFTKLW